MPIQTKVNEDADGAAEREAEFNQLKLALHLAQVDRAHYVDEMNTAMLKMKNTIESLEQEGIELLDKIHSIDSRPNQLRDQRICEDLVNLAENKDWLQQQIQIEKNKHTDLDAKIRIIEKRLSALKLQTGGNAGVQSAADKLAGKLTTLENRLVHVLKTYNDALGRNMQLRNEIDTQRLQRANFDQLYRRLDQTLTKQRATINRLIEATSVAYEQREDASHRIQQLTEKADKDAQQHSNEMKELVRLIDHERKLKNFMKIKSTERHEDPQLTAWKAKRAQEAEDRRAEVDRTIEKYEQAFDRMLELMDETNADNLVQSFLEKEDRNYALFNYVSETNAEIERLTEQNEKLTKEIADYKQSLSTVVGGQQEALADLQKVNENTKELQDETEKKLDETKETLKNVCDLVSDLVTKLQCDTTTLTRRLASSEGVTQLNLLDYLTVIEDRINQLLLLRQFIAVNDPEAPYVAKSTLIGNNLTPTSGPLPPMHPPNLTEDFEETSELSVLKPFSREELHRRVVSLVKKKEMEARTHATSIPSSITSKTLK